MPYIPVPNCAQLELVFNWDGQICQNVLHYTKAAPWTLDTLEQLTQAAIDTYDTQFVINNPTNLSLISVRATDLASQTGPVYENASGLPMTGENGSPSLPNNCAIVITKRTPLRGRSYRGRIYHMGLTEGVVTGNQVSSSPLAAIVTRWNAFLSLAILSDEANMVVVSRYTNKNPREVGVATLVTNLTTDGLIDSQRRRLPGRGQ